MNNEDAYLSLLENQLLLIDDKNFDLESWKKATSLIVSSCFGSNSAQVAAIEKIDYSYSSWALRDESGTSDPVKTNCQSTLNIIIKEFEIKLNAQSEPAKKTNKIDLTFMWLPFEDELTGSSLKRLKTLLTQANLSPDELEAFLKDLPSQTLINILKSSLLSDSFKKWLSQ